MYYFNFCCTNIGYIHYSTDDVIDCARNLVELAKEKRSNVLVKVPVAKLYTEYMDAST